MDTYKDMNGNIIKKRSQEYQMRYLDRYRSINNMDAKVDKTKEIKEFCDDHLAYLIDQGFNIEVNKDYITITKPKNKIGEAGTEYVKFRKFHWDDIKDDFIPFYIILRKEYNINSHINISNESSYRTRTKKIWCLDILEDKVGNISINKMIIGI